MASRSEMTSGITFRRAGIVGLGSIGRRHARILKSLCPEMSIAAYRTYKGSLRDPVDGITDLDQESFSRMCFDLLVIANPSALHLATLTMLLRTNPRATVLVEKPFCLPSEITEAKALIAQYPEARILPGNCLRFHPAIVTLKR